jgi:hypothetical protein
MTCTYHGGKTEARRKVFHELERHSAKCVRCSHQLARVEPLPELPPVREEPRPPAAPRTPAPLPPPMFGGPEGLEVAGQEIEAYTRNAPSEVWPAPPPVPAQEETQPVTVSRRLAIIRGCKTPATAAGGTVPTPRYAAALAALDQCWDARPRAFSAERELYELHELKAARAEVRAAWIEAAQLYGIDPDKT